MSLRFVIGRTGSGKTTLFLNEIKERLAEQPDGPPIIYIVPEQMSFLSEYELIGTPGIAGSIRTQVYSFTRLAWRILQETGGSAREHVTSSGLNMLIRKIIEDNKDKLKLFKKASDKAGFVQHMETMLTEFKHYCVTPENLASKKEEYAFGAATRTLGDKLHDMELIYTKFEEALAGKYIDSNDYLTLLAGSIANSPELKAAEIYIDGFHSFTPQELGVIAQLMKNCRRVSIALVLDRPFRGELPGDLHLFRLTGETYSSIYSLAEEAGIAVEGDVLLSGGYRFSDPSLAHLEEEFHSRPIAPYAGDPALVFQTAANRRAELEGTAREIRRLVMEEGYRYQEIAVLMRNGQEYDETMQSVFRDYSIPYFIDRKEPMLNHPLVELIRSALEVISGNWKYEAVFRAVKTDLLYPSGSKPETMRERMDRLENYCLANGIKGNRWTEPDPWPYKRFQGLELTKTVQTDAEKVMEAEINEARDMVALPLIKLGKRLRKAKKGRDFCEAVYLFLEELDVPEKLERLSDETEAAGRLVESRQHDQAWRAVIELLDQFVEILGEEEMTLKKFMLVIDSGIEAMKFSLIPPAIDQVFAADLEKSRLSHIKAAFILGMNDGVMPAKAGDDGILTDEDRKRLTSTGLEIAPSSKERLLDEDFVAYRAMTIASERLYLSYPLASDEGKGLQPSPYLKGVREMFPKAADKRYVNDPSELAEKEQIGYISHPDTAISYLTSQLNLKKRQYPVAAFWEDVYNFYMETPEWKNKAVKILSSLFYQNEPKKLSESTSLELYGDDILASVSRMELFQSCPFSHFATHGLKLKERDIFKLEAPHIGDLFHGALKWIADEITRSGLSWGSLTKKQCAQLAQAAVEELAPKLQNNILLSSNRYFYIKRKLEQIISKASYALNSHAGASGFAPVGLEIEFGPQKPLPPFSFSLRNGTRMQLQGRIDRVDMAKDESGVYLRVLDYKSSERNLDMTEVYYGLALQMLTYLDIIITHSKRLVGVDASPAGVLYFHVHNPLIDSKKILTLEDIEKELLKSFKMKGMLVGEDSVIRLMDSGLEQGHSDMVPVRLNKDRSLSKSSQAASMEDFKVMQKHVRKIYEEAGNRILDGEVGVEPYRLKERTPCQFCSYKPVCQFDQSLEHNWYRILLPEKPDEVLRKMKEGMAE